MSKRAIKEHASNTSVPKYTKNQLLTFDRYQHRRDLLSVLLVDDQFYTHTDVETILENFMKGKVK